YLCAPAHSGIFSHTAPHTFSLEKNSRNPVPRERLPLRNGDSGVSVLLEQPYRLPWLLSFAPPASPHPRYHLYSTSRTEKNGGPPGSPPPCFPDRALQTGYPGWW